MNPNISVKQGRIMESDLPDYSDFVAEAAAKAEAEAKAKAEEDRRRNLYQMHLDRRRTEDETLKKIQEKKVCKVGS